MNCIVLQETHTRQLEGEDKRRWFTDQDWDVIVWQNPAGEIVGFQICYDRNQDERALTWNRDTGFRHERVEDGEKAPHYKQSPILVVDGEVDLLNITRIFADKSRAMEPELAGFIHQQLSASSISS